MSNKDDILDPFAALEQLTASTFADLERMNDESNNDVFDELEQRNLDQFEDSHRMENMRTPDEIAKYEKIFTDAYLSAKLELPELEAERRLALNALFSPNISNASIREKLSVIPNDSHFEVVEAVLKNMYGYGPLDPLFNKDRVNKISDAQIFIPYNPAFEQRIRYMENGKRKEFTESKFRDVVHGRDWLNMRLSTIRSRFEPSEIAKDGMLPDGSRIHVVDGVSGYSTFQNGKYEFVQALIITIRQFTGVYDFESFIDPAPSEYTVPIFESSANDHNTEKHGLVRYTKRSGKNIDQDSAAYLKACTVLAKNFLIAGGTGSGKTTWANALTKYIPEYEVLLIVEEAPEAQPQLKHVIRLYESKKVFQESGGRDFRIVDAVKNALRMFPDRIFIAELRNDTTYPYLQAIQNGHDGSFSTIHASDCRAAMRQVITYAKSHPDQPSELFIKTVMRERLDMIMHCYKNKISADRYVDEIAYLVPFGDDDAKLENVMQFHKMGVGSDGKDHGYFEFHKPSDEFLGEMIKLGVPMPESWREWV